MRFLFLTLFLFTLAGTALRAQSNKLNDFTEVGILLGTSTYGGDLRSKDAIVLDQPAISLGLAFRYHLTDTWILRADALYARLRADDANDTPQRQRRGYSFNSGLLELSLRGEWHPLAARRYSEGVFRKIWSPYLFGGVGLAFINANPDFNGDTERPGISEDLNSSENSALVLPFGLGLRYDLNERTGFGIEYGFRATGTDYLDGISRATNPDKNDRYAVATLQIWRRFGAK